MVLVGSSFGSSGIFRCFRARFAGHADLFVRPVARCDFVFGWVLSPARPEKLRWLRRSRCCHLFYNLTIQDSHGHRDGAFLASAAAEASVQLDTSKHHFLFAHVLHLTAPDATRGCLINTVSDCPTTQALEAASVRVEATPHIICHQ